MKNKLKIGMKVLINYAGMGANGCNGKKGIVTREQPTNGLSLDYQGYNIRLESGAIWRIDRNADVEILTV